MRSDTIKKGFDRAPHRGLLRATGAIESEEDFQKLLKSNREEKEEKEKKETKAKFTSAVSEETEEKASNTAKIAKVVKIVGIVLIIIAFAILAFLFVDDTFTDAATTSVSSISDIFVGGMFLFVLGEILLILDDIKHRK